MNEEERIRPFPRKPGAIFAIDVAELCYLKWMGNVSFIQDLSDYLLNGLVVVKPNLFAMVRVIDISPLDADGKRVGPVEPAWFVRMAVGDLRELVAELPFDLPKICFCRRNKGRVRKYQLEEFRKNVNRITRMSLWAAAAT